MTPKILRICINENTRMAWINDNIGIVFWGSLDVPTTGHILFIWAVMMQALYNIDGKLIATGNGNTQGQATLTAGTHDARIDYIQDGEEKALTSIGQGPGITRIRIPKESSASFR